MQGLFQSWPQVESAVNLSRSRTSSFFRHLTRGAVAMLLITSVAAAERPEFGPPGLQKEIQDWREGDAVPSRLLSFPDGHQDHVFDCGLGEYLESVRIHIDAIDDDALLEALMFSRHSDTASMHHATLRLIERKGLPWVAGKLAEF
jgi:hypothetical protein